MRCRLVASYVSKTFDPVATVVLAEPAAANLDHLILTRSLPATTRARVRASLEPRPPNDKAAAVVVSHPEAAHPAEARSAETRVRAPAASATASSASSQVGRSFRLIGFKAPAT